MDIFVKDVKNPSYLGYNKSDANQEDVSRCTKYVEFSVSALIRKLNTSVRPT